MAIKMGKIMTEVACPLCKTVWFLEDYEWFLEDPDNPDNNNAYFYCNDCERNVKFTTDQCRSIVAYNASNPIVYKDILYYNEDTDTDFDTEDE